MIAALLAVSAQTYGQIYKCRNNDATVYQQQPCEAEGEKITVEEDAIILPADAEAISQTLATELVNEANAIWEATRQRDYEFVVDKMDPELVIKMGGRQSVLDNIRESMQQFEEKNLSISEAMISAPATLYQSQDYDIAFLPGSIVVSGDELAVRSENYLIASRRKNTSEWFFMDGSPFADAPALQTLFPGLPAAIKIPQLTREILVN